MKSFLLKNYLMLQIFCLTDLTGTFSGSRTDKRKRHQKKCDKKLCVMKRQKEKSV
jgi:hypothetical protein